MVCVVVRKRGTGVPIRADGKICTLWFGLIFYLLFHGLVHVPVMLLAIGLIT